MRRLWCLLLACAGAAPAVEYEDTLGTHVVEPGDTLWSITERYLGADFLWRENWKLNPQVENPHLLRPGEQLVVIKERRIEADRAAVLAVSNRVDKNVQRSDWIPAESGDELAERDGLRTLEDSSAELRFSQSSLLRLSEFSQVFLESKTADLRGTDQGRIEVEEGAADLVFEPMRRRRGPEIELVAGPAVARPRGDARGNALVRAARDAASGQASFMVFQGQSQVSSGGVEVTVSEGMGTTIAGDGRPTVPEQLLPPPAGLSPGDGLDWAAANQGLSWDPVAGAASYVVEVCRDEACGELVQRQAGLGDPRFEPKVEAAGSYFWRVRAVSATGLEGYPSGPASFRLATPVVDERPPVLAVVPVGTARAQSRNVVLLGPETRLRFLASDDASGVERVEYRGGDGEAWATWDGVDLPLEVFRQQRLQARAVDRLGRVSATVDLAWEEMR